MLVAPGPLVTMATPGLPVTMAYPSAMCPAPCSCRTRMWRIEESMIGSYTGRMAPPGRPNMTSTPCISRLLMSACAPVSSIVCFPCFSLTMLLLEFDPENEKTPRVGGHQARCNVAARLRYEYQNLELGAVSRLHGPHIVAR